MINFVNIFINSILDLECLELNNLGFEVVWWNVIMLDYVVKFLRFYLFKLWVG